MTAPLLVDDPVDLMLDPITGDLALDDNNSPYFSRGLPAIAQGIRITLRMFKGEWFLNLDEGVPWYQDILGKKYNNAQLLDILRKRIVVVPGVASIASLTATWDGATRTVTVNFEVVAVFGGTVADSLAVGAAA